MKNISLFTNKVFSLLSKREKKKLLILAVVVVIMSFIELAGVISILPFMSVVTNPEVIQQNKYLRWIYINFGFVSSNSFLIALGILTLLALIIGNLFRAYASFLLLRFAHMQNHYLSTRILENYLSRPYEYFLTINSSDLTKNVISEVGQVVNGVLLPFLQGCGRFCVILFIISFLVFVDPFLAIIVSLILGGAYLLIYNFYKRKITKMGKMRALSNQKRVRIISEVCGGVKDIKLMNKEFLFLQEFQKPSMLYASAQAHNAILSSLPRFFLEILAFGGVIGITIYLVGTRENYGEAVTLTALYAFAGYKLMPALQEIFGSLTKIRFNYPALQNVKVYGDIINFKDGRSSENSVSFKSKICIKNLFFSYSGSEASVLEDISVDINACETVGVVGATGAGKTTLVDLILGLLRPNKGEIFIDDVKLTTGNLRSWQSNIGYVPQFIYLMDDSLAANIAFGVEKSEIDMRRVQKAASLAQLTDLIEFKMPEKYNTIVGERGIRLSGGQRQRVGVARALYNDPNLLVFDEATSALDGETEEHLMRAIESLAGKKTIIMIAHRESTLRFCDKIIKITKKRAVCTVRKTQAFRI